MTCLKREKDRLGATAERTPRRDTRLLSVSLTALAAAILNPGHALADCTGNNTDIVICDGTDSAAIADGSTPPGETGNRPFLINLLPGADVGVVRGILQSGSPSLNLSTLGEKPPGVGQINIGTGAHAGFIAVEGPGEITISNQGELSDSGSIFFDPGQAKLSDGYGFIKASVTNGTDAVLAGGIGGGGPVLVSFTNFGEASGATQVTQFTNKAGGVFNGEVRSGFAEYLSLVGAETVNFIDGMPVVDIIPVSFHNEEGATINEAGGGVFPTDAVVFEDFTLLNAGGARRSVALEQTAINDGLIAGSVRIMNGSNADLDNDGEADPFYIREEGLFTFVNNGDVTEGISGLDTVLSIESKGDIRIENNGAIGAVAPDNAFETNGIVLGGGNDTVINGGTIIGDVRLGGGDDKFLLDLDADGTPMVDGNIDGGAGNDAFGVISTRGDKTAIIGPTPGSFEKIAAEAKGDGVRLTLNALNPGQVMTETLVASGDGSIFSNLDFNVTGKPLLEIEDSGTYVQLNGAGVVTNGSVARFGDAGQSLVIGGPLHHEGETGSVFEFESPGLSEILLIGGVLTTSSLTPIERIGAPATDGLVVRLTGGEIRSGGTTAISSNVASNIHNVSGKIIGNIQLLNASALGSGDFMNEVSSVSGEIFGDITFGGRSRLELFGSSVAGDIDFTANQSDVVLLTSAQINGNIQLRGANDFLAIDGVGFESGDVQIGGVVDAGAGVDTFRFFAPSFGGAATSTINNADQFQNFEFFEKTGDGKLIVADGDLKFIDGIIREGSMSLAKDANSTFNFLIIQSGASFAGNGKQTGTVRTQKGGTYTAGDSIGSNTLIGDLLIEEGGFLEVEFELTPDGAISDEINIDGDLFLDGFLKLVFLDGLSPDADFSFDFLNVSGGVTLGDSFDIIVEGLMDVAFGLDFDPVTGRIAFSGIGDPTPSEVPLPPALFLFLGGAGLLAGVRRKKRLAP